MHAEKLKKSEEALSGPHSAHPRWHLRGNRTSTHSLVAPDDSYLTLSDTHTKRRLVNNWASQEVVLSVLRRFYLSQGKISSFWWFRKLQECSGLTQSFFCFFVYCFIGGLLFLFPFSFLFPFISILSTIF